VQIHTKAEGRISEIHIGPAGTRADHPPPWPCRHLCPHHCGSGQRPERRRHAGRGGRYPARPDREHRAHARYNSAERALDRALRRACRHSDALRGWDWHKCQSPQGFCGLSASNDGCGGRMR
jgi:hypothetical protein